MRSGRLARVNELIRTELSALVAREIKDPRIAGVVSLTEVETSADLRFARVHVSVYGSEEEQQSTLAALRSAASFLRHEVAHRVILRHTPELQFELDSSIAHGDRILQLLKQVAPTVEKPRRASRARTAGSESA